MPHGTRTCYQSGCRLTECRAAEASYRRNLRKLHAMGRRPLGMLVSSVLVRRQLRLLVIEGFTATDIARRLGLKDGRVMRDTEHVTLRKALAVRWLARQVGLVDADAQ